MKPTRTLRLPDILVVVLLLLTILPTGGATASEATFSRVRIMMESNSQMKKLWENGVHIDHYSGNFSTGIELVLSSEELTNLTSAGIPFQVEAADLKAEHAARAPSSPQDMAASRRLQETDGVEGFDFGSMGGFYTFDEVVEQLDSMTLLYPHLITTRSSLGVSHQGRDIWMVKISDNPGVDESSTEKAVYYDALHHAREPESMAATLYYMFWLLENYGSDPVATYVVDSRELFFVPVVNPDGYVYNEQTDPNGGGFWRKNRRPNGGNCFGVDLNRNYSFGYGNNNGSSSDPCSETYRGPAAFSEPETQAIRDLLANINPVIAFSTHTYAERFLNPYGYIAEAPEYDVYSEFASDFVSGSSYLYGITSEMLGYFSSGTTRDYLHSEGTYAWTPELGADGFWPPQSSIIPIASENLPRFIYLAWVAGAYASIQSVEPMGQVIAGAGFELVASIKNKGLTQDATNVVVTASTSYPHISSVVGEVGYGAIGPRSIISNEGTPFRFEVTPSAEFLDEVSFIVQVMQDGVETDRDTVSFLVGGGSILFQDDAETGRGQWNASGPGQQWDTTFVSSRGGSYSFADSRYGNASNNTSNYLTGSQPIDLSASIHPRLEFWAKWSIEEDFDYARVQLSTNGGSTWVSLAGNHTRMFQGQPSYTASSRWVQERIDLSPYAGNTIQIRFHHDTDGGIPGDGFYVDDIMLVEYSDSTGSSIPCGDISSFLARCQSSGTVQSRVLFQNSSIHAGKSIEWLIDGTPYSSIILTNGTHSIARLSVNGLGAGSHSVEMITPPGCFDPVEVVCNSLFSAADEDWSSTDVIELDVRADQPVTETSLRGNFPNPFNPSTLIQYDIGTPSHVTLAIYDMLGREVAVLVDEFQSPGRRSVQWNATGAAGDPIASGLYLARVTAGSYVGAIRLLLMK